MNVTARALWFTYIFALTVLALMPAPFSASIEHGDKWLHALAYLLLAMGAPWPMLAWRAALLVLFMAFYGAFIETAQSFVISLNRHGDVWDWTANMAGGCTGVALRMAWDRFQGCDDEESGGEGDGPA